MNKETDFIVYIGRFSPYHNGHHATAVEALNRAKTLIFCIGSADSPRTIKNPWTAEERMEMIRSAFSDEENARIKFQFIQDRVYQNDEWASLVRESIRSVLMQYYPGRPEKASISLVVAEKDDTSWYCNLFPEWKKEIISVHSSIETDNPLGATKIRELMFTANLGFVKYAVPLNIFNKLNDFSKTDIFNLLKSEYVHGIEYELLYENHPKGHSINFYTADGVIYQSGHVLLVKRKHAPGKGLWALPGGHVGPNETAEEASLREIYEETNIQVTPGIMKLSLKGIRNFDHPDRSMRARIIKKNARTIAVSHFYRLDDSKPLAKVKAADDAEDAWWFPIETIKRMRSEIFEDHIDQINYWVAQIDR